MDDKRESEGGAGEGVTGIWPWRITRRKGGLRARIEALLAVWGQAARGGV